jgi:hypothetical protein
LRQDDADRKALSTFTESIVEDAALSWLAGLAVTVSHGWRY